MVHNPQLQLQSGGGEITLYNTSVASEPLSRTTVYVPRKLSPHPQPLHQQMEQQQQQRQQQQPHSYTMRREPPPAYVAIVYEEVVQNGYSFTVSMGNSQPEATS